VTDSNGGCQIQHQKHYRPDNYSIIRSSTSIARGDLREPTAACTYGEDISARDPSRFTSSHCSARYSLAVESEVKSAMRQPGFATTVILGQAPWSPARSDKWYWKSSAALTARVPPLTAKLSSSSSTDILHRADKGERGWVRSMQSLPNSTVFINVWPQVIAAFGWSSVVVLAHSVLRGKLGPSFSSPPLSTTPHAFLSTALGLVLVFRTNAAYDRFWEGRKIWGGLVNTA
jgi:hypothetical protein